MEKVTEHILKQYVDACELIKETEKEIKRLERKKTYTVKDSVRGSNHEFPYQPRMFVSEGIKEERNNNIEKQIAILAERKLAAEHIKTDVERWLNQVSTRIQRIVKYKYFENLTWEETAFKMGRNATGESVRKELTRYLQKSPQCPQSPI